MQKKLALSCAAGVLALAAGCSKSSKDDSRGGSPLSPAQFTSKVDEAGKVFSELKGLRGSFLGSGSRLALQDTAFRSPENIDKAKECRSTGESVNARGESVESYSCTIVRRGMTKLCTVTETYDGATQVGYSENCSGSSTTTTTTNGGDDAADDRGETPDPSDGGEQRGDETGAEGFEPESLDAVDDCESAFASFDSFYAEAQQEYERLAAQLKSPQGEEQGETWVKAALAGDEAIAWELKPQQDMPGVSAKGRLAGAGAGDKLRIALQREFSLDLSQMPGGQLPDDGMGDDMGDDGMGDDMGDDGMGDDALLTKMTAKESALATVDLAAKSIDLTIDQGMVMGDTSWKVNGTIAVAAGARKLVRQKLDLWQKDAAGEQKTTTDITAELVAADTIAVDATIDEGGGAEKTTFFIKKDASGQCRYEAAN